MLTFEMSGVPASIGGMRRALLRWYARHGRDLPWRNDTDPYRVWVREIMLQQTTVAAVKPYFERFTAAFPTVQQLAAANETDVLKLWEGLGYYSRARNLHRAAQRIVADYGGRLPQDPGALQSLPGIGRYTAGAIASFAYGRRAAIVEANTLRLYARLLGYADDPRSSAGQTALWSFAESILPRSRPGQFNQALMDLGATVCTPADPQCPRCPLRTYCRACQLGRQHEIPRPRRRAATVDLTEAALIVHKRGRYLLRRRPEGEWWAGLWDFPRIPISNGSTTSAELHLEPLRRQLRAGLADTTGVSASIGELLTELRHSVTHHRIRVLCFAAQWGNGSVVRGPELEWVKRAELGSLPLTAPARRLVRQLSGGSRKSTRIGR
jgi:A/G-specific adenine glycosylase